LKPGKQVRLESLTYKNVRCPNIEQGIMNAEVKQPDAAVTAIIKPAHGLAAVLPSS
jgi:hypothetical protein